MTNHIQTIRVRNGRLDPAEAEVWLFVHPERLTSATQVRGRLVGPRCPYAGTVEVAYPLRELSREYQSTGTPHLILRVVIPEASLWDPESPFLYQGRVELWQGDQLCDRAQVSHGLRTLGLGPSGLRCNGRPLPLRGVARAACSEAEARALHDAGYNTLLAPAGADPALWDVADRFGFLVLARVTDKAALKAEAHRAEAFRTHACCLGWVVTPEAVAEELARIVAQTLTDGTARAPLLGVELRQPPAGPLPENVSFVACPEAHLSALGNLDLSAVLLQEGAGGPPALTSPPPGILGWIAAPPPGFPFTN
jgi:hypothetical protein